MFAYDANENQVYPRSWTAIYMPLDNVGMWNIRSEDWGRQYLGQQFYLRVYTGSKSLRDEYPIPKNALLCGRARGRHTRPRFWCCWVQYLFANIQQVYLHDPCIHLVFVSSHVSRHVCTFLIVTRGWHNAIINVDLLAGNLNSRAHLLLSYQIREFKFLRWLLKFLIFDEVISWASPLKLFLV